MKQKLILEEKKIKTDSKKSINHYLIPFELSLYLFISALLVEILSLLNPGLSKAFSLLLLILFWSRASVVISNRVFEPIGKISGVDEFGKKEIKLEIYVWSSLYFFTQSYILGNENYFLINAFMLILFYCRVFSISKYVNSQKK